jgi:hypothetical protein
LTFSVNIFSQLINQSELINLSELKNKDARILERKAQRGANAGNTELTPDFISDLTASRIDSIANVYFSDTLLYRFQYDASGYVVSYNKFIRKNNLWENVSRKFYTNNSIGKIETEYSENWTNNLWAPNYRTTYVFNSNKLLASEFGEKYNSTGWNNDYLETYSYNSSGQKTDDVEQLWKNNTWENNSRTQILYSPDGKTSTYLYADWDGNQWALWLLNRNTMTDWGALAEHYRVFYSSLLKTRQTNTYGSQKQLLLELYENSSDSLWVFDSRATHEYDSNFTVDKRTLEKWTNSAWVKSNLQIDSLDKNKNIISRCVYNWGDTSWIPVTREFYSYNSKGKELLYTKESFSNNVWIFRSKIEYAYDAAGELFTYFKYSNWSSSGAPVDYALIMDLEFAPNLIYPFEISSCGLKIWYKNVSIPVELSSFNGNYQNENVSLKWSTSTETNNRGFEVERKTTNSGWIDLGFIAGAGTTAKQSNYAFEDKNIPEGKLFYRLKQIDFNGTVLYLQPIEINTAAIKDFSLEQNFPNPFNPSTFINYNLPAECNVTVSVYNITGQLVKVLVNGKQEAGTYNVLFDASRFSSGVYFCTIKAGQINGKNVFINTKKMLLVK